MKDCASYIYIYVVNERGALLAPFFFYFFNAPNVPVHRRATCELETNSE